MIIFHIMDSSATSLCQSQIWVDVLEWLEVPTALVKKIWDNIPMLLDTMHSV